METTAARHSSSHPAACLPPSSLSTAPERRLLAIAVPHLVRLATDDAVFQVFPSVSEVYFQVFRLDIVYVAMVIYACCRYMFQVFQSFQMYVVSVLSVLSACCRKYIWMSQNMHVASVYFKYFSCFIHMLQVFYLYVAKVDLDVACVCNDFRVFSGVLQLFQIYVASVSIVLDICCMRFI
jgi:hypothetical protein